MLQKYLKRVMLVCVCVMDSDIQIKPGDLPF